MNEMNIVFAIDDAGCAYAAAALISVSCSSPQNEKINFYVITLGLSSENIRKFEELESQIGHKINIVFFDTDLFKLPRAKGYVQTAYLRLFLSEILPGLSKVLYLDYDVLVRKPIREIYDLSVENIGAVVALDGVWAAKEYLAVYYKSLGLRDPVFYFNSGVMIINLEYWRENNVGAKCLAWLEKNAQIGRAADQDALNFVLQGRVLFFSSRWNATTSLIQGVMYRGRVASRFRDDVNNAAIVHFTGPRKPWLREFRTRYANEFRWYISQSPWNEIAALNLTPFKVWCRFCDEIKHFRLITKSLFKKILRIGATYDRDIGEPRHFDSH